MPADADVRSLLAQLPPLGEYFTVVLGDPPDRCVPSLAEIYAGAPALRDDIELTAARLGTPEHRVAGSILFQGLAARLWSAALAPALLYGQILTLDPATTWWSPRHGGGRLHTADPRCTAGGDTVEGLCRTVIDQHLTPLVAAVRQQVRLPEPLLWGNASSALMGSLGILASARPGSEPTSWFGIAEALLTEPHLTSTGMLRPAHPGTPPAFVRTSCCLYYRVPGGGLCGDCVLHRDRRSD
ncbi:(2Fe-2S)-binding protein [Actinopolymorpha alba]|uniref:(2Fe-2S)-binding protein n=1 Tax=Actinopolymorpha alba TaxID=533267 RepID=UPI00035D74D6|nr:(2Fe-2S)-binding protein [Actinopolymorpha alba]